MDFEELLDDLDEILSKGWSLPLSGGKSMVDIDEAHDIIQEMRMNIPGEIKAAKDILARKAEIVEAAKRESNITIKAAEEKAKAMIANSEIVRLATEKEHEIISTAKSRAREIRNKSYEYFEDNLKMVEETLVSAVNELRQTRHALKTSPKKAESDGEGK